MGDNRAEDRLRGCAPEQLDRIFEETEVLRSTKNPSAMVMSRLSDLLKHGAYRNARGEREYEQQVTSPHAVMHEPMHAPIPPVPDSPLAEPRKVLELVDSNRLDKDCERRLLKLSRGQLD